MDHAQGGQKLHRPGVDVRKGVGEGLHVQGVEHAAPGGVNHKGTGIGALLHLQQNQLVSGHLGHLVQLLLGDGLAVVGVDLVPHQPQGVAVGHLAPGPGRQGLSLRLLRQHRDGKQPEGQQQGKYFLHQ